MKKLIEEKSEIGVKFQTLFFEEESLENEKLLVDYPNMFTGSAIFLARKPITIETLYCHGEKSTLKIPRKRVYNSSCTESFVNIKLFLTHIGF